MSAHSRLLQALSLIVILTILFSGFSLPVASAQGKDGLKRQINAQTGKVNFIGPESGRTLPASKALGTFIRPQNPALALAKRFGSEFGLKNPERDLKEMKNSHAESERVTVRYQQNYQGIPVMGGELIVNTNENGDLYSMNGEVSSDLSLYIQPTIDSEQARQTALKAVAKWYQKTSEDFLVSEPELWIYDESLLRASTRPAELVWRMEVTPNEVGMPVHELVLINAQRGNISLHFNQIDTAWGGTQKNPKLSSDRTTPESTNMYMPQLAGLTWYVTTTGNNLNSCSSTGSPCQTINGAIGKASAGDTIKIAIGTYTGSGNEVVLIDKNVTLSGGWNASFTTQNGTSTIDGQGAQRGITIPYSSDSRLLMDVMLMATKAEVLKTLGAL